MKLALGCLAAATLIATTACGPRTPDYEKTADTALSSAALDKVDADYDKDAKTIHLKGTVDTENDRRRAADVVQKAVGGGAQVANESNGGHLCAARFRLLHDIGRAATMVSVSTVPLR